MEEINHHKHSIPVYLQTLFTSMVMVNTGETDDLDDTLLVGMRLVGISPSKLINLLKLLRAGCDEGQHRCGELLTRTNKPGLISTIQELYTQMQDEVLELVESYVSHNKLDGTVIACDGTYTHRNNNANEATETFVEQTTHGRLLCTKRQSSALKTCDPRQLRVCWCQMV